MVISMYYINNFILYSLFGHLLEVMINKSSGFLYCPWTPVYGLGVLIIISIHKIIKKRHYNKRTEVLITFIISSIILSLIELLGGYLLQFLFHKTFWNYSEFLLNIGKFIAIEISIIWGILAIIYIYLLKPLSDKLTKKIPNYITIICSVLFILDLIITIIIKIKL